MPAQFHNQELVGAQRRFDAQFAIGLGERHRFFLSRGAGTPSATGC
jgi:hypothetical protein